LVMGFEAAFAIEIPDDIAGGLTTPRQTIEYVASRLLPIPASHCLTQQTFYRLRRGLRSNLHEGRVLCPSTVIRDVFPKRDWHGFWSGIRASAGEPTWPERIPWKGWMLEGPATLRELRTRVRIS
jgi:hypothetical protein